MQCSTWLFFVNYFKYYWNITRPDYIKYIKPIIMVFLLMFPDKWTRKGSEFIPDHRLSGRWLDDELGPNQQPFNGQIIHSPIWTRTIFCNLVRPNPGQAALSHLLSLRIFHWEDTKKIWPLRWKKGWTCAKRDNYFTSNSYARDGSSIMEHLGNESGNFIYYIKILMSQIDQ